MARKSKGRQKVNMVKMQNESNLQVTFSKRRSGLFKKASELCILCGAEIVIIVFSPGQKVYSFGHPCVHSIVDRYLNRNPPPEYSDANQLVEAHRNASLRELNMELTHVENILEAERKHGETLDQMRKATQRQHWWAAPVEELNLQQLQKLKAAMEDLKQNVDKEVHKLMFETANSVPYHHGNTCYGRGVVPFDAARVNGPAENVPFGDHGPSRSISMGVFPFDNRSSSGFNGGNPFADRASGSSNGAFPFAARASGSNAVLQFEPRATAESSSGSKMAHGFNLGYGRGFF